MEIFEYLTPDTFEVFFLTKQREQQDESFNKLSQVSGAEKGSPELQGIDRKFHPVPARQLEGGPRADGSQQVDVEFRFWNGADPLQGDRIVKIRGLIHQNLRWFPSCIRAITLSPF